MSEKVEAAEVPRGRAQVAPKSMTQSPRAWLEGIKYVESVEDASKRKDSFGVRGIQLAEQLQKQGFEMLQKTTVMEPEGDVSHYLFAAKEASK
jgi:hypothetical protein